MKNQILIPILFLASAMGVSALACGTVASPTACVLNVGGQVQYTFSNFQIVASTASGTPAVSGADIGINVNSGGGLSAVLSFNKVVTGGNPNVVFLANAGNSNAFSFSYSASIAPLGAGTVLFIDPTGVELVTSSSSGNGLGSAQFVLAGGPLCLATTNSTSDSCTLPPGTTNNLPDAGNIVSLSGNTGNASIGTFTNLYNASFTADEPAGVPEPSTYALIGAGLAAMWGMKRRR